VKITVDELAADAIAAELKNGALDLGIAYRPGAQSDLRFEPLYNEEMILVVSPEHALAARKRIRMVELHRQRLVLLPEKFATRQMLNECFAACGAEPVIAAEMNTVAPMLGLVARTAIGTIVSRHAVLSLRGLHAVALESPSPIRTPGLLWKQDAAPSTLVKSFAAILRRIARDRVGGSRHRPPRKAASAAAASARVVAV
jgi:LysR family cyn operon transcriptional activator